MFSDMQGLSTPVHLFSGSSLKACCFKKKEVTSQDGGKTGCRKQKDQHKVLREMEKGDGRGELWAGHSGLCPEGKRPDVPRDGSTGNPTQANILLGHLIQV